MARADNTNHYFELASDLFNKISTTNFAFRLQQAATVSPLRPLHVLPFTLTARHGLRPESGKLNVNYVNMTTAFIVPNMNQFIHLGARAIFHQRRRQDAAAPYTTKWFQANPTKYLATYYGIPN